MVLAFSLSPWGEIIEAGLDGATMPDVTAQRCILDALRSASFDPPGGAAVVTVRYPIVLAH